MRLYGNTYYIGFDGLSLALIDTGAGLVLVDGGVPQSVAQVEANIRKLGFRVQDVKLILNTESHYDHASGLAALARDSGATVLASAWSAQVLRHGRPAADDPQAASLLPFPAVARVRAVRDGETVRLGAVTLTAHLTPGHTPGNTSWSWRSCEAGACRNVVFAASLNPVSADGFHFSADRSHGDLTGGFRQSFRMLRALPCEVLITAHPDQSKLADQLKRAGSRPNPFVDPNACRAYADRFEGMLAERLARERAGR